MICPNCGKPRYYSTAFTVTTASTVWPYCQCTYTLIMTADTTSIGHMPFNGEIATPGYSRVPQAFQDAFRDEDLQI